LRAKGKLREREKSGERREGERVSGGDGERMNRRFRARQESAWTRAREIEGGVYVVVICEVSAESDGILTARLVVVYTCRHMWISMLRQINQRR
jgi:hypothetical protein